MVRFEEGECKNGIRNVFILPFTRNFVQSRGKTTSTDSYLSKVEVEFEGCIIKTPASKENENLNGTTYTDLKSKEAELESEDKTLVKGITYTVNAACTALGISAGKEGSEENVATDKGVIIE